MSIGLDVAAGVAGLITLADVVIDRTWRTIKACKSASKESQKLLREVQSLFGILSGVQKFAEQVASSSLSTHISIDAIHECQKTLTSIRDKLLKADPQQPNISRAAKWKRILTWPFTSDETDEVLQEIERHKSTFDLSLHLDSVFAFSAQHATIARGVDDVRKALQDITRIQLNEDRRRVLDCFGTFDAEASHGKATELRQAGTGLWLTKGPDLASWLTNRNSKLWMFGIPGAGKTVLTAAAIEEAIQLASPEYGVAYYYCDYRSSKTQHLSGILASLAGQLARQNEDCFKMISESLRSGKEDVARHSLPDEKQLISLLSHVVTAFDEVALFVDGVDECIDPQEVTIQLRQLSMQCPQVRMLLASRSEQTIRPHLGDFEHLSIAARNEDLKLYVSSEIDLRSKRGTLRIKSSALKDDILEKLVNGADGMFRWAACQMDNLCRLPNDASRRKALTELPPDLFTTYDRILERVNTEGENNQILVERALKWLFNDSLRVDQLCEAVAANVDTDEFDPEAVPDIETIMLRCSSLVRSGDERRVELAHFTVKEYLASKHLSETQSFKRYHCDLDEVTCFKALYRLHHVCLPRFGQDPYQENRWPLRLENDAPFYWDAAQSWMLDLAENQKHPPIREQLFLLFTQRPQNLALWKRVFAFTILFNNRSQRDDNDLATLEVRAKAISLSANAIHFASLLGLDSVVRHLVAAGANVNESCLLGTPLHCALLGEDALWMNSAFHNMHKWQFLRMERSSTNVVVALSELGADVSHRYQGDESFAAAEQNRCSPLCLAFHREDPIAIEALLNVGASLDSHVAQALMELLRTKRIRPDICNLLLKHVHQHEQLQTIEFMLLQVHIDASQRDDQQPDDRKSPESRGRPLTPRNVEFATESIGSYSADELQKTLTWVCQDDKLELLQSLVELSAVDIAHVVAGWDMPLTHLAAMYGSTRVLKYLLTHGVEVDRIGKSAPLFGRAAPPSISWRMRGCRTALHIACHGESSSAIDLLLDHGASVTKRDEYGNTPLHMWAANTRIAGQGPQSRFLDAVHQDSGLKAQNRHGQTALHALAESNNLQAFFQLRDLFGKDALQDAVLAADDKTKLPLHWAAQMAHIDLVKEIYDLHANSDSPIDDAAVLHFAARGICRGTAVLSWLLSTLKSLPPSFDGATVSHECIAALYHYLKGAHQSARDAEQWTKRAIDGLQNFTAAIALLSEAGIPIDDIAEDGRQPLHDVCQMMADSRGHKDKRVTEELYSACLVCVDAVISKTETISKLDNKGDSALTLVLEQLIQAKEHHGERNMIAEEIMCRLLSKCSSSDISHLHFRGTPALKIAFEIESSRIAHQLIELGVDVDLRQAPTPSSGDHGEIFSALEFMVCHGSDDDVDLIMETLSRTRNLNRKVNGRGLLHLAARDCDKAAHHEIMKALVRKGLHINEASGDDRKTPLMCAVLVGSVDHVRTLIDLGASVDAIDARNYTPLHQACLEGWVEVVEALIEAAPELEMSSVYFRPPTGDIAWQDIYGNTRLMTGPLQLACISGSQELVDKLFQKPWSTICGLECSDGPTPLWWSCFYGDLPIVRILLERGSDANFQEPTQGQTCLHAAALNGHSRVVEVLLAAGANTSTRDHQGRTARMHAIRMRFDDTAAIMRTTQHGLSALQEHDESDTAVSESQSSPTAFDSSSEVLEAIETGNLSHVQSLLSRGRDLEASLRCGCAPLRIAVHHRQWALASFLLEHGVLPRHGQCRDSLHHLKGKSLLETLLTEPPLAEIVGTLLKYPLVFSDIISSDADGLLHRIILKCHPEVLKTLLQTYHHIVCPHLEDSDGDLTLPPLYEPDEALQTVYGTPLHFAIREGRIANARILLDAGAGVDALDDELFTPLHLSAARHMIDAVELLLKRGANPNMVNRHGETPLHLAAYDGFCDVIQLLFQYGACLGLQTLKNETPLQFAAANDQVAAIQLLMSLGSQFVEDQASPSQLASMFQMKDARCRTLALHLDIHLDAVDYILRPHWEWTESDIKLVYVLINRMSPLQLLRNLSIQELRWQYGTEPCSVLCIAARKGFGELVGALAGAGTLLNLRSPSGKTALIYACSYGRLSAIKVLVRCGALLHYEHEGGWVNAVAAAKLYPEVVRWLLVDRFTEQRKLESTQHTTNDPGTRSEKRPYHQQSYAPAVRNDYVPWDTTAFIAAEELPNFIRGVEKSLRLGTFYCRMDGYTEVVPHSDVSGLPDV